MNARRQCQVAQSAPIATPTANATKGPTLSSTTSFRWRNPRRCSATRNASAAPATPSHHTTRAGWGHAIGATRSAHCGTGEFAAEPVTTSSTTARMMKKKLAIAMSAQRTVASSRSAVIVTGSITGEEPAVPSPASR